MEKWYKWWFKWWVWASAVTLAIVILSKPPQLWFWLVIFIALILYGFDRSLQ
jgi:hypothetical protein